FNYAAMKAENGGRQMKNVWRFPTPTSEEKQHGKHPTQKPIALIARCVRATTDPSDVVFDPFAGSASTGVAALKLGRRFLGCEQDKTYAMLGARRLTDLTGEIESSAPESSAGGTRRQQQVLFAKG